LILHAGNVIKQTLDTAKVEVKIKNGHEPYTEADVKVQTLIIKGIKSLWPNLLIIGEEEEVFEGKFDFNLEEFRKDLVSNDLFKELESTKVNINDIIVWIDPLDGTSEFIQGCLESVTTLIGVSIKGESKMGILGKYYTRKGKYDFNWIPKCYFAHSDCPHVYYVDYSDPNHVKEFIRPNSEQRLAICTSKSKSALQRFKKYFDIIQPDQILQVGGAGNKFLHVIEGNSDCYFYASPGLNKWDICAGEAILKSIGGVMMNTLNEKFKYEKDKSTWTCGQGFVACKCPEIYLKVSQKCFENNT